MNKTCPECGASIAPTAPAGLCSRCLFALSLGAATPGGHRPTDGPPPASPSTSPPPLCRLGDYELLEEIGRGGMGVVYRARQLSLKRIVAVKVLPAAQFTDASTRERFQSEAEMAASLRHPHIVAIFETGREQGCPYFAMEYIEGWTLDELVRRQPLSASQAARYVEGVALAIQHAHERGILHRDLKPSNVLIDENDQPRVTDFGLAKRVESSSELRVESEDAARGRGSQLSTQNPLNPLTLTGAMLGSPNYMPPEQAGGGQTAPGPHGDIYSLGAILYHLLTGRPPFLAGSLAGTLHQLVHSEPVPPRLLNSGTPRDLETICLKCLEKEPAKRYPTAQALADELNRFLHDEPIHARPVGRLEKAWRWCRRKPALAGLSVAAVLLLVAILTSIGLAGLRDAAVRKAEQREYFAGITLADNYVRIGDIQRALDVLTNCPPRFRHWEWGRLMFLCHQEIATFHTVTNLKLAIVGGIDYTRITVNADQTRLVTVGEDGAATVWDLRTGSTGSLPVPSGNLPDGMAKASQSPTAGPGLAAPPVVPVGGSPTEAGESPALPIPQTGPRLFSVGGSTNRIIDMAFAPDGRRLAVLGNAGAVEMWDASDSRRLFGFAVTNGPARNVTFNSDGTHIRVTRSDSASIWDSQTGQFLANAAPAPPPDRVSPDPRRVEVADAPEKVSTPATPRRAAAEDSRAPGKIRRLAIDPTGTRLATVDARSKVQLWDAETGELRHTLDGRFSDAARLFFSPNGRRLLVADPSAAPSTVWNTETGQQLSSLLTRVDSAAFNADGSRVATVSGDNVARVWSANSGREILSLKGHGAIVRFIDFSPDSKRITTASEDGAVKIWQGGLGREEIKVGSLVEGIAFSPDGQRLAVAQDDDAATVWDVESGQRVLSLHGHLSRVRQVCLSPDGKALVTSSLDKTVRIWDTATGRLQRTLRDHPTTLDVVAVSPDGQHLATGTRGNVGSLARIWDLASGRQLRPLRGHTNSLPGPIAFHPNGRQVAVAGAAGFHTKGVVVLFDPMTGDSIRTLAGHGNASVMAVAYSSDGRMLATAGLDRMIHIWDPASGRKIRTLQAHLKIYSAAFSPDGKRLVTATAENFANSGQPTAQIWDVETGRELMVLEGHRYTLAATAFSPDGRRIATADTSGSVRIWETFPLRDEDFSGGGELSINERVARHADAYWKQRLAAGDGVSNANTSSNSRTRSRIDRAEFPARDPKASPNLIDLTEHYNALLNVSWIPKRYLHLLVSDLTFLPSGQVSFAGTPFDVRGLIQLRAPGNDWLETSLRPLPERVDGIPVSRAFSRLRALLGTIGREPDGTPIGIFVLHYADGTQREVAINYGQHVRDWWEGADASETILEGSMAWKGQTSITDFLGGDIRVFASTFENPRPEADVEKIDFVSKLTGSGPFLIALTLEP